MRCVLSVLIAASTLGADGADHVGHLSGKVSHASPLGDAERSSTITGTHMARLKSSKVGGGAIQEQDRLLGKDSHGGVDHIEQGHTREFVRLDATTGARLARLKSSQAGGGAIQEQDHVSGQVSHTLTSSHNGAGHVKHEHSREIVRSDVTIGTHMAQLESGKAGEGTIWKLNHLPGQDSAEAEKHVIARREGRSAQMMLRSARIAVGAGVADGRQRDTPSTPVIPPVVSKVASSSTERWRLIAAGMLPADALKSSASHPQPLPANAPPAAESHKQAANASESSASHHELQHLAGDNAKALWSYHTEAHAHRDVPDDNDKLKSKDGQNNSHGQYTSGGHDKYQEPREFLGLPKIFWALVADVIAMACFVACIPFILTIAKRRRPSNFSS